MWNWFIELNATRGSSGFGPTAIAYSEIEAWARLTGSAPRRHEIACLKALDALWIAPSEKKKGG